MSLRKKNEKKKTNLRSILMLYPALKNTKDGELYGYINCEGEFVIEPKYKVAYKFNNAGIAIVDEKGNFGGINRDGKYVISPIYDSISEFKEGRTIFTLHDAMGSMDEEGNVITKRKYDFVGEFHDERAVIGIHDGSDNYKYGYIDLDGSEVVAPIYLLANDYSEGIALVKVKDKEYMLIDKAGRKINTYNYEIVSEYGDGMMVYANSLGGDFGYINKAGEEIIKPIYTIAEKFIDGVAIVSVGENYNGLYGLINKSGKYIYEPIYNNIKMLGEERIALGKAIGKEKFVNRNIYAIADTFGNTLADFIYLDVGNYKNGLAWASNNTNTFFIDKNGNINNKLPNVNGSGQLTIIDDVVYANIDYSPYYLTKNSKIIYEPNCNIHLNDIYSIIKEKYKPNINYLIYNPEVRGIKNTKIQSEVNFKLKEMSYFNPLIENGNGENIKITENEVLDYNYYGTFNIIYFYRNLLTLNLTGYYYPLGAAHGMPSKKTPTIDLVTGKFYSLADLFKVNIYWVGEINKIIKNIIDTDSKYDYVFKDEFKGIKPNQDFYIDKENLYIYFPPYEIGPYAAGFITFKIPFKEIEGVLNKDGEFYKAFNG